MSPLGPGLLSFVLRGQGAEWLSWPWATSCWPCSSRCLPVHLLGSGGLRHLLLVPSSPRRSLVPCRILGWSGVPSPWWRGAQRTRPLEEDLRKGRGHCGGEGPGGTWVFSLGLHFWSLGHLVSQRVLPQASGEVSCRGTGLQSSRLAHRQAGTWEAGPLVLSMPGARDEILHIGHLGHKGLPGAGGSLS